MNQNKGRSNKILTLGFLWGAMTFSNLIRYALGIVAPTLMKLYHISPKTMGYILSGWNWSYTGSLLFMGPIVDRFGSWIIMGVGSVVWGLSTVALPIANAAAFLFLMRMLFGLGHSMLVPATAFSISREFGPKERSRAIAIAFSGNQLGLASGAIIAAFILARLGWEAVFYCMGGASVLLALAWFYFYPDKQIGRQSAAHSDATNGSERRPISWLSLFRYRSTWGIALGQMGYLYAYYFFASWLPGYLVLDRKMTLLKSGIIASLPFWVGVLCTLGGGWLGDYLIERGVRPTVSRKGIIGTGLIAAMLMVIAAAFIEGSWLAVTLLTLCVGFLRLTTGSINSLPIDLAPQSMVGSLTSIQNFSGNIGGLLAPIVTGYIVNSTGSFVNSLVVAGGMALLGAISYVFVMGNLETHQIGFRPPIVAI